MKRLVIFHSRWGAAALAAALQYAEGAVDEDILLAGVRSRSPLIIHRASEAIIAVACKDENQVWQRAIDDVVACFRPEISTMHHALSESGSWWPLWLWLLRRQLCPRFLAQHLIQQLREKAEEIGGRKN